MRGAYPAGTTGKRLPLAGSLAVMVFQALWLLLSPANSTAELVLSLTVVAAALLLVAAAAGVTLPLFRAFVPAPLVKKRAAATVRLSDPDAAGRPRPRAPSVCPAAV
jgi:Family of unknown function (DUF6412)